tara:strand:+ start:616 stop:1365 length:750 start_codon:yes stop_codon:yes gene_type:complete
MQLENKISNWLNDYLIKNKLKSFVIGISGGIDSAVTSTLCAMTRQKTIVVTMPIHQNQDETIRGRKHIDWMKNKFKDVEGYNIDLTIAYETMKKTIPSNFHSDLALANTRARLRMSTLYMLAGSSIGLVVGTGNKIEDFGVGFFTKYGDGGVDISPIADLMKSEVYLLAKSMGINNDIINAAPTDGLWDDERTDEEQLGVTYDELEWAMNYDGAKDINQKEKDILDIYFKHRKKNIHKMKPIPIYKKET